MRFIGRSFRNIVTLTLASALAFSSAIVAPSANAAPAAPVITSLTTQTNGNTQQVTVNFTYGDASTVTGFKYSTDGGTLWDECNSSQCNWTSGATFLIIQKLSGTNNSMGNGDVVNVVIKACGTGSGNSQGTGLSNCSGNSRTISYTVGVASIPSISTSSTIANGAINPSVTITGSKFETNTSLSLFTIGVGTTGLTASSATWDSATSITFAFTGTASAGTISITASLSAYAPTTSSGSNTVSVSVAATTPGAPTSVSGATANSAQINLTWTAPASNGGSSITDYLVQYSSDNGVTWETFTATASSATSKNVTGLSASTSYIFRVAAKNSVGYGPFSSNSSSVTTSSGPTVPETPTALSAGSPTTTSLQLSWTAPGNNGGAAITGYFVQFSSDNGMTWDTATVSTSSNPYSVTGLTASTSYIFRVAAINSVGTGPFSNPSSAASTSANTPAPSGPAPEIDYAPTITDVSKLKVCARGQENFVIRGNNFKNATVTIDGVQVSVKGKSDNVLNISFGETTTGKKIITVTNPAGKATVEVEFKLVDKTAFKVFDIPYIYKGGTFLYQFEAFGENTFRVTGNMPAGLVLNAETGEISGIPTEEGMFNFVLHADGLCGNDSDVIKLDIDKEIPNAISHRIKFKNPKSKKIVGTEASELKKFINEMKKISPKQIQPIIYITGGSPDDESEVESQSAKDRQNTLCDIMLTEDLIGQTVLGLFDGEEDEIEIFVYWPVVR